eukprot:TRINITY_DN9168_c0_g1_i1.p1 TRINITY_DN9168_c0_g1~~TRINITY_DN9168_c0_g1_i1.p1  ORF type:complete len:198 (+),score=61.41 TRINITY_DN9168_c0_g1_i1:165-758(+)
MCIRDRVSTQSTGDSIAAMPSVEETPQFLADKSYFVGVWRRTEFDVAAWPMCLNNNNGTSACVAGFDADAGTLWEIVHRQQNQYILKCVDGGDNRYLGEDLQMKRNENAAQVWTATTTASFRGGPYDTAVQLSNGKGQLLCSKDSTRQIALLTPKEADELTKTDGYAWNNAWECSAIEESNEEDEFLAKYSTVSRYA